MSKSQKRKLQILSAALDIVTNHGIQSLTISELARATSVSKSLIVYYYDTPEEIVEDLYLISARRGQDLTQKRIQYANSLPTALSGVIGGAFEWVVTEPNLARLFLLIYHESSVRAGRLADLHRSILETGLDRIRTAIISNKKWGTSRASVAAESIQNLLIGAITRMVSLNDLRNWKHHSNVVIKGAEMIVGEKISRFDLKKKAENF